MDPAVSQVLGRFIASLNLSRQTAQEMVQRFGSAASVNDLPEWIRETDDENPPSAIRSSAPGEHHYKHGWIPIDPLEDLKAAVASGELGRDHLGGGRMAETSYVYYRNGTDGVHKQLGDVSDVMGSGYDAVRQADAEEKAAELGHAIGAPTVKVLRTGPDEIVMDVADGISANRIRRRITDAAKTNADYASANDRELEEIARAASTPEGIRLGAFDVLAGNWDRQPDSNWNLTDAGTPVGYDHSFAFDGLDSGDFETNTPGSAGDPPNVHSIGPFAAHFVKILPDGTTAWDDNPLSPADIDFLRRRLASLESAWAAAGRHDWWQFASDRLEAIAPHATGTESRFAT